MNNEPLNLPYCEKCKVYVTREDLHMQVEHPEHRGEAQLFFRALQGSIEQYHKDLEQFVKE